MGYLIDGCCRCRCTTVALATVSLRHRLRRRRCHRRRRSTAVALATGVTSSLLCCCGTAGHPCHLLGRRRHPCRFPLLSQTDTLNMLNGTETTGISCGESVDTYLGAGRANRLVDQSNSVGSHTDTSSRHADVPSVQTDARTAANAPENVRTQRKRRNPPHSPNQSPKRTPNESNGFRSHTNMSSVYTHAHSVETDTETAVNDVKNVRMRPNGSKTQDSPIAREIVCPSLPIDGGGSG